MSRCLRQDFLLDSVDVSDMQVNYRQEWIQRRLLFLSDVFAIDLLSFAIMDNHTHLVLFANLELAQRWSNLEVLQRWSKLGKLPLLCQLYLSSEWRSKLNDIELVIVLEQIDEYRRKLTDVSIFMSRFNYYIAKRANKEDKKTGHFWEARFKSHALLDAQAVLSCMQYVDLNPIRAKKSTSLSNSYFTSIKYRLDKAIDYPNTRLVPLRKTYSSNNFIEHLKMSLQTYILSLEMLVANEDNETKFTSWDQENDNDQNWQKSTWEFEKFFYICAGEAQLVSRFKKQARLYSGLHEKETQALSEATLCRLLDSQYRF